VVKVIKVLLLGRDMSHWMCWKMRVTNIALVITLQMDTSKLSDQAALHYAVVYFVIDSVIFCAFLCWKARQPKQLSQPF